MPSYRVCFINEIPCGTRRVAIGDSGAGTGAAAALVAAAAASERVAAVVSRGGSPDFEEPGGLEAVVEHARGRFPAHFAEAPT